MYQQQNEVDKNNTPSGWARITLQNAVQVIDYRGRTPPFSESGIPHLRSNNVKGGKVIWDDLRYVSEETYRKYMTRGLPDQGDLLFTTEAPLGQVALVPDLKFSLAQRLMILKPDRRLLMSKFLMYQIQSEGFQRKLRRSGTGTTVKGVSSRNFRPSELFMAPVPEQQRIVDRIEELFSDLDTGVKTLKTVQLQLKVYRQAVLKWAFEGKFTEGWRVRSGTNLSRSELWAKIETVKRQHGGTKKAISNTALLEQQSFELPEIPGSWHWITIGDLTLGVEYGTSTKSMPEGKMPVLRMGNIQNCAIDWSDLVYSNDQDDNRKYLLHPNDVLFNRTNSPELVGKTAIYRGEIPAIFAGYLIRIKQLSELADARYLNYFLNSAVAKNVANKVKTDGVNQSNINGQKLIGYPFPACLIEEQKQVADEIEARLSVCDSIEQAVIENLRRSEALRQSILQLAFAGKLVPQDPNDEPAEKTLKRVREERSVTDGKAPSSSRAARKSNKPLPELIEA